VSGIPYRDDSIRTTRCWCCGRESKRDPCTSVCLTLRLSKWARSRLSGGTPPMYSDLDILLDRASNGTETERAVAILEIRLIEARRERLSGDT
jgi:hypothetical protein